MSREISTLDLAANTVNAFARLYVDDMERAAQAEGEDRVALQAFAVERFMALRSAVRAYEAAVEQSLREHMALTERWRKLAEAAGGQS